MSGQFHPEIQRLAEIAVDQMQVRHERERGRVVAEEALDLDDVAAVAGEEQRRGGVAEGMEADPRDVCVVGRASERPAPHVLRAQRRAVLGGKDQVVVRAVSCVTPLLQLRREALRDRDLALGVLRLGLTHLLRTIVRRTFR